MLAKEIKIRNLIRQREFIKKQLDLTLLNGNAAVSYVGEVFPENLDYFHDEEGYDVQRLDSKEILTANMGMPIYVFSSSDVKLTPEELEKAESYDLETALREQLVNELVEGSEPHDAENDTAEQMAEALVNMFCEHD